MIKKSAIRSAMIPALLGVGLSMAAADEFEDTALIFLEDHCLSCHDSATTKGGVDLERFASMEDVFADRDVWAEVYEKVESHQMPPPKRKSQPTSDERAALLDWIKGVAAEPDPRLGARDPGKPVLRRLNRLEYNNTVRDLFGLDVDVFSFPERLPARKGGFDFAAEKLPDRVEVNMREYGSRTPVLLPQVGLPGDGRAAHGFNNRGDVMNVSPLVLEKYMSLAAETVAEPTLPFRSASFARLIGVDTGKLPKPSGIRPKAVKSPAKPVDSAVGYAPNGDIATAESSDFELAAFRQRLESAAKSGTSCVFDVPAAVSNRTVAGKGDAIDVRFAGAPSKEWKINPDADLWLVSFGSAKASSGGLLLTNKEKGAKNFELTFTTGKGSEAEQVKELGVCVLARKKESGEVILTATLRNGESLVKSLRFEDNTGNVFVGFEAPEESGIRSLRVDGRGFSGDYVLIDDLAIITDGQGRVPQEREAPPVEPTELAAKPVSKSSQPSPSPRERLSDFLSRAFRRPVSEEEVTRYFSIYDELTAGGADEAAAMRQAVMAVLASPSFLFLEESETESELPPFVRPLNDHELANRMSYFIWSSMPDDELRALADAGKLADPVVRAAQARRMLRDEKARELSESFAVQWLRLDQLYTAQPDRQLFRSFYSGPQGKNTLHASLLIEALLLFESVIIEDRSIIDLLDPGYAWLNGRLVRHYGLESVAAPYLSDRTGKDRAGNSGADGNREVKLPPSLGDNQWFRLPLDDKTRGGVMTLGGSLTVTSLPFRTSPVKRGAWLLETLFNRPPTEPKIAFAIENDTKEAATKQSVRERFEAHRNKAACYSCHVRLDPPGFALERFDPVGAWRETDGSDQVDARADWNGVAFDGPGEFKKLLAAEPREFTRGFTEHLLSYALGRQLGIHDMPTIAEIQARTSDDGWKFGKMIEEIVISYPFSRTQSSGLGP